MKPARISGLDRLLNDFATRCFRDVADGDYIAARMAYRARLFPQFLWSCQQALEKYLKCILLQNRIPARNVGHELARAVALLGGQSRFPVQFARETLQFIEYIDAVGRYRYFEASYYVREYEIVKLDSAVWDIRRYAECHDYWISDSTGELVHMLPFGMKKIEAAKSHPPSRFVGVGGVLEKIIADPTHPARSALVWQNHCYTKRVRKTLQLVGHMHASNAPLFLHPEILEEVQKYVLVPKSVAAAYRNMASDVANEIHN